MSKVFHYNGEDFKGEVVSTKGITLVDFFATWCGPCQMLGPVLDDSRDLAAEYGVRSVPTMFIFKDGEVAEQMIGFLTKDEIKDKINSHL